MIRLISTRFEVPMAESCHISVEQAEDCMSALLPKPQAVAASGRDRCGGRGEMSDGIRL